MDKVFIPGRPARLQALPGSNQHRLVSFPREVSPPVLNLSLEKTSVSHHRVGLAEDVVTGARPGIFFGPLCDARAHGIRLDKANLLENGTTT